MSQLDSVHANKMTGYKITTVDRTRKFGITANSLEMLKDRALKKFNVCDFIEFFFQFLIEVGASGGDINNYSISIAVATRSYISIQRWNQSR